MEPISSYLNKEIFDEWLDLINSYSIDKLENLKKNLDSIYWINDLIFRFKINELLVLIINKKNHDKKLDKINLIIDKLKLEIESSENIQYIKTKIEETKTNLDKLNMISIPDANSFFEKKFNEFKIDKHAIKQLRKSILREKIKRSNKDKFINDLLSNFLKFNHIWINNFNSDVIKFNDQIKLAIENINEININHLKDLIHSESNLKKTYLEKEKLDDKISLINSDISKKLNEIYTLILKKRN